MIVRPFYKHTPNVPAPKGHRRNRMSVLTIFLLGLWVIGPAHVAMAQEEPSPIEVELTVPQQAGPGQLIDVLIKYNATDLNAGAVLNYNLFGPGRIWTRTPEPPNPIVNTWGPKFDSAQGSIKIQVQIEPGADGQTLQHQVEVKWGPKFKKFAATTQIQYVPPTATPTQPPRPTATRPAATATPTSPAQPTWSLTAAAFVAPDGSGVLSSAAPNQEIALEVRYNSSQDVAEVTVEIQFEPDVVNLDGVERTETGYAMRLTNVPAASGGLLFDPPLRGRVRFYAEGQDIYTYTLQAVVEVHVSTNVLSVDVTRLEATPLQITQPPAEAGRVTVQASVDSQTVQPGGNMIVHARCTNSASVPVSGIRLAIVGLADGFNVVPEEHIVETIAAGETAERVFTIRTPDGLQEGAAFRVAVTAGEETIESEPISVAVSKPVELGIQAAADKTQVRAGESARFSVTVENRGDQAIEHASVRLIDVTGNLGVLLQNVDRLAPGATRDLIFAVQVPEDFPADVVSSMVVQVLAADGTIVESAPLSLDVICVPDFELLIQAPTDTLRAGESAEVVVTLRNISQCKARDVVVGVGELPASFTPPPEVRVAELGPGETRQLTFNLLIPEKQAAGGVNVAVSAADSVGVQETARVAFLVGGVSVFFTIVFTLLVLLAVGAIVVGTVLYFRQR